MPIVLVNMPLEAVQSISRLVGEKRYSSLEEFVLLSITNQLAYESSAQGQKAPQAAAVLVTSDSLQPHVPATEVLSIRDIAGGVYRTKGEGSVEPLKGMSTNNAILWAQYYRLLPLKASLRLLENMSDGEWPEIDAFKETAAGQIPELATALRVLDERGLEARDGIKLSVGFPNARKPEKSMSRFLEQYVGSLNRQGFLYGFGESLGFLGVSPSKKLGLILAGRAFASIRNPVLDDDDYSAALGDEEVAFLMNHMHSTMPAERRHIAAALAAINSEHNSPAELDRTLGKQYEEWFPDQSWSEKKVASMRAGAVSRLREMGLISVIKDGVRVTYRLCDGWREIAAACFD